MTEQEWSDVQELLDALPRCERRGDGARRCANIATMTHPTAVIGDWTLRCAEHPAESENEFGARAMPTRWAAVAERLAAQGFRGARRGETQDA